MPLTSVVEYLHDRLHQLHPTSRLSEQAGFRYRQGMLTAGIAGFKLIPDQVPVVRASDGSVFAYSAQLKVESSRGHPMKAEALYVHAWEAADVLFLDRFLRTFHALHHLNLGHDEDEWLVLGVHLRHVSALPEQHGQVFQELLHRLGLAPGQVILRLNGRALQRDPHVQLAARSFAAHGYQLLVHHPDTQDTDWPLLRSLGVRWLIPDIPGSVFRREWEGLDAWSRQARAQGIALWADGIDRAGALERANTLAVTLVEGNLFRDVAALRIGRVS